MRETSAAKGNLAMPKAEMEKWEAGGTGGRRGLCIRVAAMTGRKHFADEVATVAITIGCNKRGLALAAGSRLLSVTSGKSKLYGLN
jgi:hypothetical protein